MTSDYIMTELAENGQFGSWLSNFMKCGATNCGAKAATNANNAAVATANSQIEGQIALLAVNVLSQQCKGLKTADAAKKSANKILLANNAYAAVQSDPSAVQIVTSLVVNDLLNTNNTVALSGCNPTPTASTVLPQTTVGNMNIDTSTLLIGGGLILASILLSR